jgi:hypothetical protein
METLVSPVTFLNLETCAAVGTGIKGVDGIVRHGGRDESNDVIRRIDQDEGKKCKIISKRSRVHTPDLWK